MCSSCSLVSDSLDYVNSCADRWMLMLQVGSLHTGVPVGRTKGFCLFDGPVVGCREPQGRSERGESRFLVHQRKQGVFFPPGLS